MRGIESVTELEKAIERARQEEREMCAQLCEGIANVAKETATGRPLVAAINTAKMCASLISLRGEKDQSDLGQ